MLPRRLSLSPTALDGCEAAWLFSTRYGASGAYARLVPPDLKRQVVEALGLASEDERYIYPGMGVRRLLDLVPTALDVGGPLDLPLTAGGRAALEALEAGGDVTALLLARLPTSTPPRARRRRRRGP